MTECLGTETLVDFVEGRADASIRARVEHHASHCEECRSVLSSLARGSTTTNVMPAGTPTRPSDPALALAADMTVGRYIIQRALGAGGMGVVYAARDPELDRVVAVKVLRGDDGPSMQERLRREAKAMAQVAHPNVVAVYDVGAIGDRIFIAMEYIDGETLSHWLKTRRTQRAILDAYRDAGRGLAVAHAAGIVHRDFKPENVLVGKDGRVRVVDFGLARTAGMAEPASIFRSADHTPISPDAPTELANLTKTGAMVGTPYYMAPELYDGAAGDARSDQFSLCVALFTALYARRPFDGDTLQTLADNTREGRINEPASRVPRRIRAAIRRGLAVDPAARFGSIEELLVELEPPSRLRVLIPVAAIAMIGVGAGLWKLSPSVVAPDERCTGAVAAFAPAWNPERRAAIDKAFGASHLPYAPFAAHEVDDALDRYADGWIAAHTDACRASQVRGEQTEAMLDR
ncbi:MAG TPA: serine/threonine-protein kinase, partial [Kofleriaceae bacterium]|nr:serine/threonine-protein kinase [Kofleriaceae bacterium]